MASELMLIKSKMLLPKTQPEEEDPRAELAEALLKYQQAKAAAALLGKAYPIFSGRMVKDTDEISVDKTFVADQSVTSLCLAVRRIIAYREEHPVADKVTFTPMIANPIVPVEAKIVGILRHFEERERVSLTDLIEDSVSLPDMIAIFLGVLELMKMRRIVLAEDITEGSVFGLETQFLRGTDSPPEEGSPETGASEFTSDFDSDSPADFVSDKEVTADAD
jgi:segregation and condensation protein A